MREPKAPDQRNGSLVSCVDVRANDPHPIALAKMANDLSTNLRRKTLSLTSDERDVGNIGDPIGVDGCLVHPDHRAIISSPRYPVQPDLCAVRRLASGEPRKPLPQSHCRWWSILRDVGVEVSVLQRLEQSVRVIGPDRLQYQAGGQEHLADLSAR